MDNTREEVLRIASEYVKEHYPEYAHQLEYEAVIVNQGTYWEVFYRLPENVLGGTPVIHIDIKSKQVIDAYLSQ